jgi:hypothetical protein
MDIKGKKYTGYGYHGGGRKTVEHKKVFVSTSVSGTPEEIATLKRAALSAGKSVSRYVLDLVISDE